MVESPGGKARQRCFASAGGLSVVWHPDTLRLNREGWRAVKPTASPWKELDLPPLNIPDVMEVVSYGRMKARGLSCGSSDPPLFTSPRVFFSRMSVDYIISILQIIMIDIVLSGDNAVVIALAAHKLPAHQRNQAILWGGGIAIFMRIVFTMVMAFLLMVPGVRLFGGLVLLWIAVKLLLEEEEHEITPDNADQSALAAIRMIFVADFMMSLDNMLAVAGASHGDSAKLLMGLLVSIAIIMTCSGLIARLMNRFPIIVWIGTAILALTAAEMILGDREVARYFVNQHGVSLSKHWEQDYMYASAELPKFDGLSQLPEDLKPLVRFDEEEKHLGPIHSVSRHLRYAGQMTPEHRDQLLAVCQTDEERKAIEAMYDSSRVRDVPGWVPGFLRPFVQPKFDADSIQKIEGRRWHHVAPIFNLVVVLGCLAVPWWIRRRRSPPHSGEYPQDGSSAV
jgi:YjbE family integral membrane protein